MPVGDAVASDVADSVAVDAEQATPPDHAARPRWFVLGLILIVAVGWGIRLAYVWFVRRHTFYLGDPLYYHESANLLAHGKGFINPYAYADHLHVQAADHPPLYFMYLSVFSVLGMSTITWHLLASTLLGAASIAVAGLAGREIVGPRAGLIAALLVAIYPHAWRYDGMLLSESMVILMVLLSIWTAYRYWHAPSVGRLVVVGLVVGLGTLARSELVLMAPFLVVPLALLTPGRAGRAPARERGRAAWRTRGAMLAVGLLAFSAVVVPWVVFNLIRFDHPVILSENLGGTLATSNCDRVYYGDQIGYWYYDCGAQILDEHGLAALDSRGDADRILRNAAFDYMLSHKGRVPVVVAARLGRITGLYQPAQSAHLDVYLENTEQWVANLGLWSYYVLAGLAVAGAVVLRRRGETLLPLLAPIVTVLVTVAAFYAATRFRATAEGALCLLAAIAVDAAIAAIRRRSSPTVDAPTVPTADATVGGSV